MKPDELRRAIAELRWWHRIDLGSGIVTPGLEDTPGKLGAIRFPEDLRGKTVLDIGASDGFFSFEAERRGAERVVAIDRYYADWPGGWGGHGTRAGFELARKTLGSGVEFLDVDCLELSPQAHGTFDLVLFLGVLYHLKHPLLGLERAASVAADMLILETHVDFCDMDRPAMAFYPGRELNDDVTNWWGPNPSAVVAMLRSVGFRRTETVFLHMDPRTSGRAGRMVVHAWK